MDVATLGQLLHETAEHHDHCEKAAPPHDWWDFVRGLHRRPAERQHP
jgi:hypothetical protein